MTETQNPPIVPANQEPWQKYQEKGHDCAGRIIECIAARSPEFIIYTTICAEESSLLQRCIGKKAVSVSAYHVEATETARVHLSDANVLVAKIHSIAPRKSQHRATIDKQLSAAYEMALRGRPEDCKAILVDILSQVSATQTAKGQLRYMLTNVAACCVTWYGYIWQIQHGDNEILSPWLLAGTLGSTGGVLSVAINLKSININVHQHWLLQCFAGWTRNVVAFLGGAACLIAIRSKIALGIAATTDVTIPPTTASLQMMEVFFCFLAGFSEGLVPNILRDSERDSIKKKEDEEVTTEKTDRQ